MAMALKVDVEQRCRTSGSGHPIDLVFLSSRTMGDRSLEHEILGIFESQLPQYVDAISNSGSEETLRRAAHTLKGAAQSVGANMLAEMAGKLEEGDKARISMLRDEADRVVQYIRELEA